MSSRTNHFRTRREEMALLCAAGEGGNISHITRATGQVTCLLTEMLIDVSSFAFFIRL